MKTAVSIPDELFREAERVAEQRGMTRSGLYAEALRRLLPSLGRPSVTDRVNAVYGEISNALDPVLEALQFEALGREDWTEDGAYLGDPDEEDHIRGAG